MALAARSVVALDGQQAGVFALRTGVGLQADAGITRGLAEPGAQLFVQQSVALLLVGGSEGVHVRELGPGDGNHLAGRVELHGAAAQRDHAAVQRQVFVGQSADVAQHAGLGMVAVEHRVRHEIAGAAQFGGDQRLDAFFERIKRRQRLSIFGEHAPQRGNVLARGGFVERDGDALLTGLPQVHARVAGALHQWGGGVFRQHPDRVKGRFLAQRVAHALQSAGQDGGVHRHALRDALQALRAVVHRVHAGDHGGQHLRGADVGGGLFAADVLLARLQCQAVGRVAVRVDAHTDQAAGQGAFEGVAAGHVGRVRATGAHGHAQALCGADHDVGAHLARGFQQREGQQIGGHDEGRGLRVALRRVTAEVFHQAGAAGVLRQGRKVLGAERGVPFSGALRHHHLNVQGLGPRLDHFDGLRMAGARDHEHAALALHRAHGQRHGLGRCGGLVQHRGVGDVHAGQVGHHGLEVDQCFHAAL